MASNERSIEWAINLFRPLLKDLHIQHLDQVIIIDTARYPFLRRYHMDSCLLVVTRYRFEKSNRKGVFCWQYDKETGLYALYIILNDTLYTDVPATDDDRMVERKAITTHEYTHCIAAILTISQLSTPLLIEKQSKKLAQKFHALEQADIKDIMNDISFSIKQPNTIQLLTFTDSHFRTGDEDFPQDYVRLYRRLLFSYSLFTEYCCEKDFFYIISQLKEKDKKTIEYATTKIFTILQKITKEKHLDIGFAFNQFVDEILPLAIAKYKQNH